MNFNLKDQANIKQKIREGLCLFRRTRRKRRSLGRTMMSRRLLGITRRGVTTLSRSATSSTTDTMSSGSWDGGIFQRFVPKTTTNSFDI